MALSSRPLYSPLPTLASTNEYKWPTRPALSVSDDGEIAVAVPFGEKGSGPDGSEVRVYGQGGELRWSTSLSGAGSLWINDAAFVPGGGTVFVGNESSKDGKGGQDAVIYRMDEDGVELWRELHAGSAHADDRYIETLVDTSGNVIVFGDVTNDRTGRDLFIKKLTP